ncbi:hypothetical protein DSO57_1031222 [Entomophthora muscae]|uniref:Uncharacterized protein n=1 Tax=Entomophthora muscae TaxID=34485 RepID=A0ACC2RRM5_9FUNG|nr:hypothetical protein DSO57_1031222 [Entomophthora muscae]
MLDDLLIKVNDLLSTKKTGCVQEQSLCNLKDLTHTVDEHFVLAFKAKTSPPSLATPPTMEETLSQLDCLLLWCCPALKKLEGQQKTPAPPFY